MTVVASPGEAGAVNDGSSVTEAITVRRGTAAGQLLLYLLGSAGLWALLDLLSSRLPAGLNLTLATLLSTALAWSVRRRLAQRYAETRRLAKELAARIDEVAARVNEKRRSEEKFSRIFHASPVTIIISRLDDGRQVDVNFAFEQQFGWARQEALGSSGLELGLWPNARAYGLWLTALRGSGRLREYETSLRTKDGATRQVAVAAEIVDFDETQLVITLIHDLTDLRRAVQEVKALNTALEDRVRQRTAELCDANRELESFAYSISHDLRAPLRGIDGFAHLLADEYGERIDGRGREYLQKVRQAAQRMGVLIDDLLELSRVNRRELQCEQVDLSQMAREVAEELRKSAPQRHARFDIAEDMQAYADPQLLRVVLENLLGNAWKYTSRQEATLISVGRDRRQDGSCSYFVRDNGVGFDMAYAGKLFHPFQRLHKTEDFPGSGIGLASVARIVRRHRGQVWAQSAPDKGAIFHFSLQAH